MILSSSGQPLNCLDLENVDISSDTFRIEFNNFIKSSEGNSNDAVSFHKKFKNRLCNEAIIDTDPMSLDYVNSEWSMECDEETAIADSDVDPTIISLLDDDDYDDDYDEDGNVMPVEEEVNRNGKETGLNGFSDDSKAEIRNRTHDSANRTGQMPQAIIQFRLPDGSSLINYFPYTATLEEVRVFLKHRMSSKRIPYTEFHLAVPNEQIVARIPQTFFTENDFLRDLQQLNLTPRAVLLIVPVAMERNIIKTAVTKMGSLFWYFTLPIIDFMQRLKSYFFGGGNGNQGQSVGSHSRLLPPPPPPDNDSHRNGSPRNRGTRNRYTGGNNIHTLYSASDDDMNTYNGNSTQQMQ